MVKKILAAAIFLTLLVACSEQSPSQDPLLKALEEVGELSTEELTLTRIMADNDGNFFEKKFGKRKIAVTMTAYVEIGVDLKDQNNYNVFYDKAQKSIKLLLPPVEITNFNAPLDKISGEYENVSGLRFDFKPEDRSAIYKECQEKMKADAEKELEDNRASYEDVTRLFFQTMLSHFGYEQILVEFNNENLKENGKE